jgi:SNF2 family DNA or RNA helicase
MSSAGSSPSSPQVAVSPKLQALVAPYSQQVERLCSTAKRFRHQGADYLALPHRNDVVRLLRNLGHPAPAPILYYYNWAETTPFDAQRETAALLSTAPRAYVLSEMGTGKTRSVLYALDYLMRTHEVRRAVVVAPLSTLSTVWESEVFRYFPHRRTAVLHGTKAKRLKALASDVDFYVINHDGVGVILPELTKRGDIDAVVIDELAVFRNSRAQRWKLLRELTRGRRFIWGLTGSPTPNAPTDAFAQVKLITPERLQGGFTLFQSQTMSQVSMFRWAPKPDAAEKVHAVMQPSVRFRRDDCMDLPPVTHSVRDVDLTEEQSRAFEAMKRDLMVEYAAGEIVAANEGVKINKLLQIAGGFIYDGAAAHRLPCEPRFSALDEIMEQAASKVIVFAPFIEAVKLLDEWARKRGYEAGVIHGDVAAGARRDIFNRFQHTTGMPLLVAHPQTMAHGLTLTSASTIVWYLPSPSLEIYEQANARITRPGQPLHQHIIHLQATEIEKRIYRRLEQRAKLQGVLLDLFAGVDEGM